MALPTRNLVLQKVRELFPTEDPLPIMALLDLYGTQCYERERERVQLAILKLSGGRIEQIRSHLQMAKQDYRDVLAYAEYPQEMQHSDTEMINMSGEAAERVRKADRQQYLDWLEGRDEADEDAT